MQNHALTALAALLIASPIGIHAADFSDHNWTGMGGYPGANDPVNATVTDSSGNLYIVGAFTIVGDVFATNIAKWDGTNWSALGSGLNDGVTALAVLGNDVYAAGYFTTAGGVSANHIAKWNGTNWSALGSGITGGNAYVYSLAVSGNDVYASGTFTNAGGNSVNNIAKWNGANWSALGSGLQGNAGSWTYVDALAVSGNDLYAGGQFTIAGGVAIANIARWNGSGWSSLGSGVQGTDYLGNPYANVSALAVSRHDLYVAGYFSTAGGIAATNMAKWNGSSWSTFPSPIYSVNEPTLWGSVNALTISGDDLYAAGNVEFDLGGGASTYGTYVAKWNGSSWSRLGTGMDGALYDAWDPSVSTVAVSGTNVYAGGAFTTAGNKSAHCIAKWNGSSWSALGSAHSDVSAMVTSGRDVYGMVNLEAADGTPTNFLAKWNGRSWSALGPGLYGVSALAVVGSDLYAAGGFTDAGGIPANHIARWNGTNWSALGSGLEFPGFYAGADALAVLGRDLYVTGYFSTAGGIPASSIAKWNGSSWSALGSGLWTPYGNENLGYGTALAVSGHDLYAGGQFLKAGGIAVVNIAKWDGTNWLALGSGYGSSGEGPAYVRVLAAAGSNVYVGGANTFKIAKWDGSTWSAFGSFEHYDNNDPDVLAMAVSGNDLYVGGWFKIGDAYNLVKWDGSSWSALGSGVNETVYKLAVTDTELIVAGGFTTAGGRVSPYMARARIGSTAQAVMTSNSTASIRFSGVTGYPYDVQRTTNLTPPITWTTVSSIPLYPAADGAFTFTDTDAPPGNAFYRASLSVPAP